MQSSRSTANGNFFQVSKPKTILMSLLMALGLQVTPNTSWALETSSAIPKVDDSDFSLEDKSDNNSLKRKEIESFLKNIEDNWNNHNLEEVMSYYSDNYVNNDGLTKKAVRELTKDFWKTYPDAKSSSKTKNIRVEGKYATVESRDKAVGSTAKPMPSIGTKGILTSISEGQLYLKKVRGKWKIIGDRVDYEKVKVAFGIAKDLSTSFVAPELVKSGQEYSAKITVQLPSQFVAVGSIASEPLKYPQPAYTDVWRPVENKVLERIIHANKSNHNELLMATIGITDRSRTSLKGLTYLTRRMNVVPKQEAKDEEDSSETAKVDITSKDPVFSGTKEK